MSRGFYQYDTRPASAADQIMTLERLLEEANGRIEELEQENTMTNLEKMLLTRSSQDLLEAINKAILETIPESYSSWHGWPGSVLIANRVYRAVQEELE